jgi:hypothetical protein
MTILHGPMRWLVAAAIVAAALGHALGLGDGGTPAVPAAAGQAGAVSVTATAGATLVVGVGYNAGWRGPTLAAAGAYSWIESGFRPTAVSSTGCRGLWQICPTKPDSFDPQINANQAHRKWAACRGGSFDCDWTPYDQGAANPQWATGYALAQKAMAALPNGGQ